MFGRLKKSFKYMYYRYELETHIYMFEPWERNLINTIVLVMLFLLTISGYVYLPSFIDKVRDVVVPNWEAISSLKMPTDEL